jgi:drug/metabolite transporter (DMT)-like permease
MTKYPFRLFIPTLVAAALFGLSAPLSKILLGEVSGVMLASLLYLGSGIGLLFFRGTIRSRSSVRKEAGIERKDLIWLAGGILAGGVAAPIALLSGLESTPASVASLMMNFEGVATALIASFFFKEAIGRRSWVAVLLIFLGSLLLTFQPGQWAISLGALSILSACVFWGIDNNFTRNISSKDPIEIVTIKGLCAGAFSLILALLLGDNIPGMYIVLSALLLGFFSYGLSTVLFVYSLRNLGAARTGALFGTAPFIGAIASFLLLREEPNILFMVALPLMLAGVYLLFSEKHEHAHTHDLAGHEHITHKHPHLPDTQHRHKH